MPEPLQLIPIGTVRRAEHGVTLEILEPFRAGLRQLNRFSHVLVFWWASLHDNEEGRTTLVTELPYAPGVEAGVFACRAEYRPNPIAVTACKLYEVDPGSGTISVADIDAYDGTPVLDLKPYIPVADRLEKVEVPEWYDGWPDYMPDEGFGLYED
jgi:tRNA-Thr(GGU) m(6)t(6)A37 methyltransferase TsaA